jgi:uncharacterized protein (TIGR00251 family)
MGKDLDAVELVAGVGGIELTVKVAAGASQTRLVGAWGTALKLAVAAPAEGGKANAAVVKLVAEIFGVKKTGVCVLSGQAHPVKRIAVEGITVAEARSRLERVRTGA